MASSAVSPAAVGALLKRHKVKIVQGHAELVDGKTCKVETDTGPQTIRAEHVILATGSVAASLPSLPFGGKVISSTEALSLQAIPERLVVVGAGYIGLELGTAFAKLGAKVTIVEAEDRILPAYDAELVRPVAKRLQALGVDILLRTRASGLAEGGDAVLIEGGGGSKRSLPADRILVATGRCARLEGFGLERLDLTMNGPFVAVDERCATSMRNVWAVGDITGEPMLAHRAMAQGAVVAEVIAGHRRVFDSAVIPAVCFTDPEIVTVGLSPEAARQAGREVRVASFPFQANGRALTFGGRGWLRACHGARRQSPGPRHRGRRRRRVGTRQQLCPRARNGCTSGRHRRHYPCASDLGRGFYEASLRALGEALHI